MKHNKFEKFIKNAEELKRIFGIVLLLYGSTGLEILTGKDLSSDDIDILIPEKYLHGDMWEKFKLELGNIGYRLIDEHEHTFLKDDIKFSYASIENLIPFAGININDIEIKKCNGISFLLLSLEQYLRVYEKSSHDGYRVNVKEKQDEIKIKLIKSLLYK